MKTFLVTLTIQAGEYEKSAITLVEAETKELAVDFAIHGEAHSPESLDWDANGAYDLGGEFYYSVRSAAELNAAETEVFNNHLDVYPCSKEELAKAGNWLERQ
ncbi:hypothetical protein VPHK449_0019 [Vibrio phage K449]